MQIQGAEIFAVGKWNGMEFSPEDLDQIVANFDTLRENHKVPLKLGHNDEQPVTDGQPALGWVDRVYRQGNKLLADFTNLPKTIYEAIKKRLYRTVSVELLMNTEHKGSKYKYVLDAVALLGADHPAVNTLGDLDRLLASRADFSGGRRVAFDTIAGNVNPNHEVSDMDSKELDAAIDAAVNKALSPIREELDSTKAELEATRKERDEMLKAQREAEEKRQKERVEAARKAVNETLDGLVREGAMTPATRETYSKQIGLDDDAKVVEITPESIKELFMGRADFGRPNGRAGNSNEPADENAEEKLILMTRQNMAETGESDFTAAFTRVAAANPKLHSEYLLSNGEK